MNDEENARALAQMLAGAIHGWILEDRTQEWLKVDTEFVTDGAGTLLPEVFVTGRVSGARLRVRVEVEP